MIKVYLANLGKYNEGKLVGAWLELPCTEEEVQEKMVEIGVAHMDGEKFVPYVVERDEKGWEYVYEEFAIHDSECEVEGLEIKEYSNLEKLNELAEVLSGADEYQMKQLEALLEWNYIEQKDLLDNSIENILGKYFFLELDGCGRNDEETLGYALAEMDGSTAKMEEIGLVHYFDYEGYGRNALCGGWNIASNNIAFAE